MDFEPVSQFDVTSTICADGGPVGTWQFINCYADVYIVPNRVWSGGEPLLDITSENRVSFCIQGGYFLGETIALPGGTPRGEYDLILDDGVNGKYDAGWDDILGAGPEYAFKVVESGRPMPDVSAIKGHAAAMEASDQRAAQYWEQMLDLMDAYELASAVSAGPMGILEYIAWKPYNDVIGDFTQNIIGGYGANPNPPPPRQAYGTLGNSAKHWGDLARDPADPNFMDFVAVDTKSIGSEVAGFVAPYAYPFAAIGTGQREANLLTWGNLSVEQAGLVKALRQTLEKYQGADQANNDLYIYLQSRQLKKYAEMLAANLTKSVAAITQVRDDIINNGDDKVLDVSALAAFQQRVGASGLTQEEIDHILALGFTMADVDELKLRVQGWNLPTADGKISDQLNDVIANSNATITTMNSLATTSQQLMDYLAPRFTLHTPTANPGGPYLGSEGLPVSLDASSSGDPDNQLLTYEWDLDGDGVFDNATGVTPSYQWDTEFVGTIGLKVTDPDGNYDIAYANVTISSANAAPAITAFQPVATTSLTATAATPLLFSVSASDADGDALSYTWTVNGVNAGTGPTFTYTPAVTDHGNVTVRVTVSDGNPYSVDAKEGRVVTVLPDADGDGFFADQDCNDADAAIHPGAAEQCDLVDNNCDGVVDEGFDNDHDGVTSCGGDCDDNDAKNFPGNTEVCDQQDNNCNGQIDEGLDTDADGDGVSQCAGDCNDNDPKNFPGNIELCDNQDNNCDGVVDEGFDTDGDGFTSCNGDCNDANKAVYPNAPELCDSLDNNCNGVVDESVDQDNDGVSVCAGDCDDTNPAMFPGNAEICDGVDNNCDGTVDEGFDLDGDGVTVCAGDCNDHDPNVYLGHPEVFNNGKNDDCNAATYDDYRDSFIIVTDDNGRVYYAKSNGDGTWANYRQLDDLPESYIRGAAIADYDNDGDLDFLIPGWSGSALSLYLYVNDGSDNFVNAGKVASAPSTSSAYGMTTGDFNHDGNMDFFVSGDSAYIAIGLGDGAGHFAVTTSNVGGNGRHVDVADFDGDGNLDVIRGVYSSGQISLFKGKGDGTFINAGVVVDPGTDPYGVTAADFNGDGFPDILANEGSSGNTFFYAGNGDGTFKAGVEVPSIDFNNYGAFDNYDFNGDGKQDVVATSYSSYVVRYYPGNGDGTFGAPVTVNPLRTSAPILGISAPPGQILPSDPIAHIDPATVVSTPGATINLSGAFSQDDGTIVSYAWDFGDSTIGSGVSVSHTFPNQEGEYRVRLTVTDNDGHKGLGSIVVRLVGQKPQANAGGPYTFGEDKAIGGVYTATLNGSSSVDDSSFAKYEWDFGDGFSDDFADGNANDWTFPAGTWGVSSEQLQQTNINLDRTYAMRGSLASSDYTFEADVRITGGSGQEAMLVFRSQDSKNNYEFILRGRGYNDVLMARRVNNGWTQLWQQYLTFTVQNNTTYHLKVECKGNLFRLFLGDSLLAEVTDGTLPRGQVGFATYYSSAQFDNVRLESKATGANPQHTYPEGSYPVTLTVTDSVGQTATDNTIVNLVKGSSPVANPGGPYTPGEAQANCGNWTVAFDGSGSTDDGGIYGYSWDFGDGTATSAGVKPSHTYSGNSARTVSLTVTDNALLTNTATTTMTPTPGAPPAANPGGPYAVDESAATGGLWTVNFNGTASSDDVGLCDYKWNFGDGATGTGPTPSHNYGAAGVYTVMLTVRDHALQSHSATTTVTVSANNPPVANHGGPYAVDETVAHGGKWTVAFDAGKSTDDFGIWKYEWNFGDGTTGTGVAPTHDYAGVGTYTVTLTVTDDGKLADTVTTQVVVSENNPPVANPGGPYVLTEGDAQEGVWKFTLDGSGSTDDHGIFNYLWAFDPRFKDDFAGTTLDETAWIHSTNITQNDGLTIAGTGSWGARYLFSTANYTRREGMTFEARVTPQNLTGSQYAMFGFKNTSTTYNYQNMTYAVYFNNGNVLIYEDNSYRGSVTSYTRNKSYDVRIVLKERQGATYYLKEAGAANWTTIYDSNYSLIKDLKIGTDCNAGTFLIHSMALRDTATVVKPAFKFDQPGAYGVGLTVIDNALQDNSGSTTVTITKGQPPVAAAGNDITTEGYWPVSFNGGNSSDDFGIEKYQWDFGDGTTGKGKTPSHIFWAMGDYTTTLTVYDKVKQSDSDTLTVHVITGNPPVANAGGPYTAGVNGPPAYFNGSASTDDYGIVKYLWDVDASVDSDGDGNFTNDIDVVGRNPFYTYSAAGTYTATLTVEDGAGQTSTATATVNVTANLAPDVICVPWVASDPLSRHETYNGNTVRLKAIVRDSGTLKYQWDFGDGSPKSPATPATVSNKYAIEASHVYPTSPENTPFTATLTVWDSAGLVGTDQYHIIVRADNLETRTNIAIDEGLWYTHKNQNKTDGHWESYGSYFASATASAIQAFEINGHLQDGDNQENPYVETVNKGLSYMFLRLRQKAISVQTYGDPDTNGNGIGIEVDSDRPIYEGGMVMDAIASSTTPLAFATTGGANVKGRFYYHILTDMVDAYAWGQDDNASAGGWRYSWGDWPDNSACQWAVIGMHAAQDTFGINIPQWVKDRNDNWLNYSYDGTGFGYTGPSNGVATTPSGMVQLTFDEKTTDDFRWRTAEDYIATHWFWQNNNYYGVYALTKAMKLAKPQPVVNFRATGLDWYNDPTTGVRKRLVSEQGGSTAGTNWGSWVSSGYGGRGLDTSWAVIMLTPTLFVQPPVADAGSDIIWAYGQELKFDASGSFHKDPIRSIVKYEWDFNGDGIWDFTTTNPSDPNAKYTYPDPNPGVDGDQPQVIIAKLRVTDNNDPAQTDIDTREVTVAEPPHAPFANAGGPYKATAGIPFTLDGSGSFDIDPGDSLTRYQWDLDNDGVWFDNVDAETTQSAVPYTYATPGTYSIGLKVWDKGAFNPVGCTVGVDCTPMASVPSFTTVVVEANLPPVADAKGPYSVDEGSSVLLDGSGSSDPNGDQLTYSWDLDNDGQYDDATGLHPSFAGVDDGVVSVGLQVSDTLLNDTATAKITVNNVAPSVNAGGDATITEGAVYTGVGSFTDPGSLDTHTATVDYGDGSGPQVLALQPGGNFGLNHTYAEDGTYTVTVQVTDDDGGSGYDTVQVTVVNAPPQVNAGGDQAIAEGETFSGTGFFTDPGVADTHTATVDYGDGSGPQPLSFDADGIFALSHTYADDGVYPVTVTVTDDDGGVGQDTVLVTVNNLPPAVDAGPDKAIDEGAVFVSAGSVSDPGTLDTHSATVDYGDGSATTNLPLGPDGSFVLSHLYVDNGTFTVMVTATDNNGGVGADTAVVTVHNVAPVVDAGPGATIEEGSAFVGGGSFTDPGSADSHTATVDYGDGSGELPLSLKADGSFDLNHIYADNGSYTVTVKVMDKDGASGSDSTLVTVENVAPVVDAGPDQVATIGGPVTLSGASFVDPSAADSHSATVDWGDGSPVTPASVDEGTGKVSASHSYTTVGDYTITVTVSDDDGGVGSDTTTARVTEQDLCPDDPLKLVPGTCGCGVSDADSDRDGTADCNDQCPNDPLKVAPGTCGCGVSDADSDQDGTADCNDQCPNDPLKVAPGTCGCGVSDADSDRDGTADCNDQCPNDPLKVAPGTCGCGVSDADANGNGIPDCQDVTIPTVTDLKAVPKLNKVTLVWTHVSAASYNVYRSVAGGAYQFLANTTSTYSTYADVGLAYGVKYCYRVRAVGAGNGEGTDSNEQCATPTPRAR